MSDRVSVTIRIGGRLPRELLVQLVDAIDAEGLTDPLGDIFDPSAIDGAQPLELTANEVAWGRLDILEAFCLDHALPFERWCASYPGGWEAERLVFDGASETRSYTATDNDLIVVTEADLRSFASIEAVRCYVASASIPLAPLTLV